MKRHFKLNIMKGRILLTLLAFVLSFASSTAVDLLMVGRVVKVEDNFIIAGISAVMVCIFDIMFRKGKDE